MTGQRQLAAALGTTRLPNSGVGQPDVRVPGWAVQVKTRAELPGWLWSAVDQAARDAGPGEAPCVVLAEVTPGRKARRLAVLAFDDFVSLIGGASDPEAPGTASGGADCDKMRDKSPPDRSKTDTRPPQPRSVKPSPWPCRRPPRSRYRTVRTPEKGAVTGRRTHGE